MLLSNNPYHYFTMLWPWLPGQTFPGKWGHHTWHNNSLFINHKKRNKAKVVFTSILFCKDTSWGHFHPSGLYTSLLWWFNKRDRTGTDTKGVWFLPNSEGNHSQHEFGSCFFLFHFLAKWFTSLAHWIRKQSECVERVAKSLCCVECILLTPGLENNWADVEKSTCHSVGTSSLYSVF